jgi:hypothetical protein
MGNVGHQLKSLWKINYTKFKEAKSNKKHADSSQTE